MLGFDLEGIGWYTYEIVRQWLTHHDDIKWTLIFDRSCDILSEFHVDRIVLGPKTSHTPSIAYWNEVPLTQWLNKHKPHIYFSSDGFIPLRSSVLCVPVVHDLAPLVYPQYMRWRDYIYYRLFQLKMIRCACMVFTVSNFSKNEITKLSGVSPDLVHVAYNGLHSGFTDRFSVTEEVHKLDIPDQYFIYYGSIHPRKNVFGLVKSFEIYRANGGQASLVLSGRRAWKVDDVEQTIVKSPAADYIKRLPYLENNVLQHVVKQSLGLVYISHYEGFGLPVLEAMASGVPVITSANSAMSEIGGQAVLTCPPLNHEEVARQMKRLEEDVGLRLSLIEAGRKQAQKFSYVTSSMNILKLLKTKINEA